MNVQKIIKSLKKMIEEGNISHIVVKKGKKDLLNIPASVGVLGAAVGLTWAKLPLLAAVLATLGYGCKVEVVQTDGKVIKVVDEKTGKKILDFAAEMVEKVKESIPASIDVDVVEEEDAVEEEPVEEKPARKKAAPKKAATKAATKEAAPKKATAKKAAPKKAAPKKAKTPDEKFAEVVAKDEPKE